MRLFQENVIAKREKDLYEKRTRLFKASNDEQLASALQATREMGRIPVFIRTLK